MDSPQTTSEKRRFVKVEEEIDESKIEEITRTMPGETLASKANDSIWIIDGEFAGEKQEWNENKIREVIGAEVVEAEVSKAESREFVDKASRGHSPRGRTQISSNGNNNIVFGQATAYTNTGTINNYNYAQNNVSLFSSLAITPSGLEPTKSMRPILAKKVRYQAGRQLPRTRDNTSYLPYATVKNRRIKARLLQIAQRFQFLDRGFAEYFQVVIPSFNKSQVQELLKDARENIISRQSQGSDRVNDMESIYLGDLGDFCEGIALAWEKGDAGLNTKFEVTHRRDHEILHYLQDAFEVPYWELMADLFLGWRLNSQGLSGEVVLRVLDSQTIDVRDDLRRLHADLAQLNENVKEDIRPILIGIDERLAVLESVLISTKSNPEGRDDFLFSVFENIHQPQPNMSKEKALSEENEFGNKRNETVILIALIVLFLIGAIIPGYKAFAISMTSNETGSIGDADFWYLVQASIMSVLGSLISIVPLLKSSWFSPAYSIMWLFFILGLAFAAVSICIYPLLNTGWSSIFSFLSSISSVASVLVMTLAIGKNEGKVKRD